MTFPDVANAHKSYLAWLGQEDDVKFMQSGDIDRAAELLCYRFFSHGLYWAQLGGNYGGAITEMEWRLLYRILTCAAYNNAEYIAHVSHPFITSLMAIINVLAMVSTGLGSPDHWAHVIPGLNPTTCVTLLPNCDNDDDLLAPGGAPDFLQTPCTFELPANATELTNIGAFAVSVLQFLTPDVIQSCAHKYMKELCNIQDYRLFSEHFFGCFLPLHRLFLLSTYKQEFAMAASKMSDEEKKYFVGHLVITPWCLLRVGTHEAVVSLMDTFGHAFVQQFAQLAIRFQAHAGILTYQASPPCSLNTDSHCPSIHGQHFIGVLQSVFALFQVLSAIPPTTTTVPPTTTTTATSATTTLPATASTLPSAAASSSSFSSSSSSSSAASDTEDEDAAAAEGGGGGEGGEKAVGLLRMVPLLECEAQLQRKLFFGTAKAAPAILELLNRNPSELPNFNGYLILLKLLNDLSGCQELQSLWPADFDVSQCYEISRQAVIIGGSKLARQQKQVLDEPVVWITVKTLYDLGIRHQVLVDFIRCLFEIKFTNHGIPLTSTNIGHVGAIWSTDFFDSIKTSRTLQKFITACLSISPPPPTTAPFSLYSAFEVMKNGKVQATTWYGSVRQLDGNNIKEALDTTTKLYDLIRPMSARPMAGTKIQYKNNFNLFQKNFSAAKEAAAKQFLATSSTANSVAAAAAQATAIMLPLRSSSSSSSAAKRRAVTRACNKPATVISKRHKTTNSPPPPTTNNPSPPTTQTSTPLPNPPSPPLPAPSSSRPISPVKTSPKVSDTKLKALEAAMAKKDGELRMLTDTVAKKDGELRMLTDTVAKKDGELRMLTDTVAKKDGELRMLTDLVAKKDCELKILADSVAKKDGELKILVEIVAKKDGELRTLADAVAKKDGELRMLTDTVAKKDGELRMLTDTVAKKEEEVKLLDEQFRTVGHDLGQDLDASVAKYAKAVEDATKLNDAIASYQMQLQQQELSQKKLLEELQVVQQKAAEQERQLQDFKKVQFNEQKAWAAERDQLLSAIRDHEVSRRLFEAEHQQVKDGAEAQEKLFKEFRAEAQSKEEALRMQLLEASRSKEEKVAATPSPSLTSESDLSHRVKVLEAMFATFVAQKNTPVASPILPPSTTFNPPTTPFSSSSPVVIPSPVALPPSSATAVTAKKPGISLRAPPDEQKKIAIKLAAEQQERRRKALQDAVRLLL